MSLTAYCVKCKAAIEIKDARPVVLGNKRPAVQGVCPKCGTKVSRIVKPTEKVQKWMKEQEEGKAPETDSKKSKPQTK